MPAYVKPTLKVEIDFTGNPTATMADILESEDGVVSYWRCNSTSTFLDSRGTNDGAIIGTPTLATGAFPYDTDQALAFDGSADGAYVPTSASLTPGTAFSVAGWVKLPSLPGATADVIAKRGSWLIRVDATGHLVFTIKNDTVTGVVTSIGTLATGSYYHYVATYDGATMRLYINGTLDNSAAYSSGIEITSAPVSFASAPSGTSPTWQSTQTNSGTSTSVTCNTPASTASGDLLLAHIYVAANNQTFSAVPSGWESLGQFDTGGGTVGRVRLFYKIATGSEPGSYTWTQGSSVLFMIAISRITGQSVAVPFPNPVYSVSNTSTTIATGSHLPNVDNNMVLAIFTGQAGSGSWTESSGTERYDFNNAGTTALAMSSQTQSAATSLTVTGTTANANNSALFVVVAGSGSVYTACTLDEPSYWNVALTGAQVATHYASRNSGTGTWVDVTADVRQVQIRGGRQYELDRMEARTATVVLNDKLRKYDPANQASVYWPNVVPMRRLRVSLIHSAVTYPVFTGFVERWPPETIGPRYQEVTVSAVDGFDGLARASLSGSVTTTFSGTQIDEILNKAYWPESNRSLDAGQYVMIGDSDLNTTALQAIQDIADSELGVFFIDGEGDAVFHDRAHRGTNSRSTTSQASFVEASNSTVTYHELSPSFDRDRIINTWEISPHSAVIGGTVQTATDPDSIAKYFLRTSSRSTKLSSNTDALAQANQLLNETAQPALRFDVLVLVPYTSAQWAAVLPLQISDRVTVTRTPVPSAGGTTIVRDCFIEGMSWAITPSSIQFSLQLSPVSSGDYYHTIVRDGPVSYWRMDTVT